MKKIILLFALLIAAGYMVFRLTGAESLDWVINVIRVIVLIYAFSRCFAKAVRLNDRDALFTGTLGLGLLVVSKLYQLVFSLLNGAETGLSLSDFNDICSYLFFMAAMELLLLVPVRWETAFRIGIGTASVITVLAAAYSVMTNRNELLYITAIGTALLCAGLAVWLLYQSHKVRQLNPAVLFAAAVFSLGTMHGVMYSIMLVNPKPGLLNVCNPLYIILCLLIGLGLLRLRSEEEDHG